MTFKSLVSLRFCVSSSVFFFLLKVHEVVFCLRIEGLLC